MIYTINFSLLSLNLIFIIFYFRKIYFFRLNTGPPHFSKKFVPICVGPTFRRIQYFNNLIWLIPNAKMHFLQKIRDFKKDCYRKKVNYIRFEIREHKKKII